MIVHKRRPFESSNDVIFPGTLQRMIKNGVEVVKCDVSLGESFRMALQGWVEIPESEFKRFEHL